MRSWAVWTSLKKLLSKLHHSDILLSLQQLSHFVTIITVSQICHDRLLKLQERKNNMSVFAYFHTSPTIPHVLIVNFPPEMLILVIKKQNRTKHGLSKL